MSDGAIYTLHHLLWIMGHWALGVLLAVAGRLARAELSAEY